MKNQTFRLFVLIAFVVASVSIAPPAEALPMYYTDIVYYDCDWNIVAESIRDCSGYWSHYGNQTGARYRETYNDPCSGFGQPTYSIEYASGPDTWHPYNGNESTWCYCDRMGGIC